MSSHLAFQKIGCGPPLVILHGLFGCKENWRYPAKILGRRFTVFTLDQRNHGQSFHDSRFDYSTMADDLLNFLQQHRLDRIHLLGHSMGGKTAMQFAARHPDHLFSLIVEDISPGAYTPHHGELFAALEKLPLDRLQRRSEADSLLQPTVSDPAVRQFLLKNLLRRPEGGFAWRFNLAVLKKAYPRLISALEIDRPIEVPTLFVRGDRSDYLPPQLPPSVIALFPKARLETIAEAGHWVHAEQPAAFLRKLGAFLDKVAGP